MDPLQPFQFLKKLVNKSGNRKFRPLTDQEQQGSTRVHEETRCKPNDNQSNRSDTRSSRRDGNKSRYDNQRSPRKQEKTARDRRSPCCRAKIYISPSDTSRRWNFGEETSCSEGEDLVSRNERKFHSTIEETHDSNTLHEHLQSNNLSRQRGGQTSTHNSRTRSPSGSGSSCEEDEEQSFYNSTAYQSVLMEDACEHNYQQLNDQSISSGSSSDEDEELARLTDRMTFGNLDDDASRDHTTSDAETAPPGRGINSASEMRVDQDLRFRPTAPTSRFEAGDTTEAVDSNHLESGIIQRLHKGINIPDIHVTLLKSASFEDKDCCNDTTKTDSDDMRLNIQRDCASEAFRPLRSPQAPTDIAENEFQAMANETRQGRIEDTTQNVKTRSLTNLLKLLRTGMSEPISSADPACLDENSITAQSAKDLLSDVFNHSLDSQRQLQYTEELCNQKTNIIREQRQKIACLLQDNKELVDKTLARDRQYNGFINKYKTNMLHARNEVSCLLSKRGHKYVVKSVISDAIRAREEMDEVTLHKFALQNKVNELRMLVVQQQRKIVSLQQSEHTLKSETDILKQRLTQGCNEDETKSSPSRNWVREYLTTKMADVLDCDDGFLDPLATSINNNDDQQQGKFDPMSIPYVLYEATDRGQDIQTISDLIKEIELSTSIETAGHSL